MGVELSEYPSFSAWREGRTPAGRQEELYSTSPRFWAAAVQNTQLLPALGESVPSVAVLSQEQGAFKLYQQHLSHNYPMN